MVNEEKNKNVNMSEREKGEKGGESEEGKRMGWEGEERDGGEGRGERERIKRGRREREREVKDEIIQLMMEKLIVVCRMDNKPNQWIETNQWRGAREMRREPPL